VTIIPLNGLAWANKNESLHRAAARGAFARLKTALEAEIGGGTKARRICNFPRSGRI